MDTTTISLISRVGAGKVRHFAGARPTRVTYQGVMEREDGTRDECPHHAHPTADAAIACARAIWRRERKAAEA